MPGKKAHARQKKRNAQSTGEYGIMCQYLGIAGAQQDARQPNPLEKNPLMADPIYKVIFLNQNQVYEVYAKHVYQSDMYGFIEIEEFVFGKRSQMIVDPGEERLKAEFSSVKRSYIPMHALIRVDEVEKEGIAKVSDYKGENVTPLNIPKNASPIGKPKDAE